MFSEFPLSTPVLNIMATDLLSIDPVMRNPRASRASTVRQASLPLPFALDSKNKLTG